MSVSTRWFAWVQFLIAAFVLSCLLIPPAALAQSETATVSGRVVDQSGAIIVGAEVEIKNVETNIGVVRTTNRDGLYSIPSLHPGHYLLTVRKPGFKTVTATDLTLNVQDNVARNVQMQVGSAAESVTVSAEAATINTTDATVSTVIDRDFAGNLPLNGRSFNTLIQLTPGVAIVPPPTGSGSPGQFSVAGERTNANNFTVDGVSANFGVTNFSGGNSGTGSAQAFSAVGGTSSLVSADALQEFRVETSSYSPQFGRQPGGQVMITTRAGTNQFHGSVFDYFRNTGLDANTWFNNAADPSVPRAPEHHNDFGGVFGGPIVKDKTFFFLSYEGARLSLPQSTTSTVPSVFARSAASPEIAPYLNAYPLPDDRTSVAGVFTAPFTASYSNRATLDAVSLRVDHTLNDRFSLFGRYNYAPSDFSSVLSEPNNPITTHSDTQTLTIGMNMQFSNRVTNALRWNYSSQSASNTNSLNSLGGAVPLDPGLLLDSLSGAENSGTFGTFDTGFYSVGAGVRNHTTQLNFVDDLAVSMGTHLLQFGGDYRAIFLHTAPPVHNLPLIAFAVQDVLPTTPPTPPTVFLIPSTNLPAELLIHSLSLYAQDTWKVAPRLNLVYGLRWELSPAPTARGNTTLASWTNTNVPSQIALAPSGTPPWSTTYTNFAPRIGIAYSIDPSGSFVLRGGLGMFYDLGTGPAMSLTNNFPNVASGFPAIVSPPVANPPLPEISRDSPFSFPVGFASDLKLPRSYQWNVALEKAFRGQHTITATYVGKTGRRLLRSEDLFQPNPDFADVLQLTKNTARSNYQALQLQYRKPLSSGIQALLNYTWSHALDNASDDTAQVLPNGIGVIANGNDYSSSDFDIRHSFSGAITWDIPSGKNRSGPLHSLARDWSLDAIVVARTGLPFNAKVTNLGLSGGAVFSRPDLVASQPKWIADSTAGGGKSLNPLAFVDAPDGQQGTEPRNDIIGFGLTQIDLSISRKFPVTEKVSLQFRTDAFNLFNHPNFANPSGFIDFGPLNLRSPSMLNQALGSSGGLNPLFQQGGPRSLQISLRLSF